MGRGRVPASDVICATEFHDYFDAKVEGVRRSTADAPPPSFTAAPLGCKLFAFQPLSVDDVEAAIRLLPDKQSASDPFPTRLLKDYADVLTPFLVNLFNRSLSTGLVPTSFKSAFITPLLKKTDLDAADVKSYRPISNLSVVSKLLERLVAKQLVQYLGQYNLLPDLQSAFRAYHSTETAVLKVLSDILHALDTGDLVLLMLLDLSAAFDTVDHDILIRRLETSYGLDGAALGWLTSYLDGRTQSVRCGPSSSAATRVLCGVPQGSVLEPIILILYTADLVRLVEKHNLQPHLYADDTQVYGACLPSATKQLQDKISACLAEIALWMRSNRLQLNTAKTEALWCSSGRRQHQIPTAAVQVGPDVVSPVRSVRDLGLYLDSDVSMKTHISRSVSSCFAVLRQIRSISRSVTQPVLLSLVVSLVLSRLDYGNAVLAGLPNRQLDRLQSVLNAAARLIFSKRKFDHVTPLLRELHWLRVPQRIDYKLAVLVYRCLHHLAPSYLSTELCCVADLNSRQRLRSASTTALIIPTTRRSTLGDRTFSVAGARVWNSLPTHVTSSPSLPVLKKRLKTHLFEASYS